MKFFAFLVLPVLLVSANYRLLDQESKDTTSLSIAIKEIMEKVVVESNRFDIRIYGSPHGLPELNEILTGNKNVPVNVKKSVDQFRNNSWHPGSIFEIKESAIMIFESFDLFWTFMTLFESKEFFLDIQMMRLHRNFFKPLKFFVFIKGANAESLKYIGEVLKSWREERKQTAKELFDHTFGYNDMNNIFNHFYFILNEEKSIKLYTFLWYTQEKCSEPQLFEVNVFDKNTNQWKSSNFMVEKYKNFYGCHLVFVRLDTGDDRNDAKRLLPLLRTLRSSLNFGYEIILLRSQHNVNANTRSNFTIGKENVTVDLFLNGDKMNSFKSYYHMAQPYMITPVRLMVPPGQPYDAYEKLLLPFDEHTWLLIGLTFVAAFSIVFFFKFFSQSVTNFVFGPNVASPSLNIVMIFCGMSQNVQPRRNFARFLIMMFIIYSLIIRTAWQSQMFKFFQKEIRKPEIKSLEEMVENGFTFFLHPFTKNQYNKSDMVKGTKIELISGYSQYEVNTKWILDYSFRGATIASVDDIKKYSSLTKGKYLDRISEENLYTEFWTWKFPKFHRFLEVFDEKIQQLITAGIVDHLLDGWIHPDHKKKYEHLYAHLKGPQVLTMKHLEAGFVIWLVSVCIAILAFLLEWMTTLGKFLL